MKAREGNTHIRDPGTQQRIDGCHAGVGMCHLKNINSYSSSPYPYFETALNGEGCEGGSKRIRNAPQDRRYICYNQ